jgi:hypothetical protein
MSYLFIELNLSETDLLLQLKTSPDLVNIDVIYFFFDMSTQKGGGGLELVTFVSLDVVPAD